MRICRSAACRACMHAACIAGCQHPAWAHLVHTRTACMEREREKHAVASCWAAWARAARCAGPPSLLPPSFPPPSLPPSLLPSPLPPFLPSFGTACAPKGACPRQDCTSSVNTAHSHIPAHTHTRCVRAPTGHVSHPALWPKWPGPMPPYRTQWGCLASKQSTSLARSHPIPSHPMQAFRSLLPCPPGSAWCRPLYSMAPAWPYMAPHATGFLVR